MHHGGNYRSKSRCVRVKIQLAFSNCFAQAFFKDRVERIQAFSEYPTHCWSMHGLGRGGSNKEAAAGRIHRTPGRRLSTSRRYRLVRFAVGVHRSGSCLRHPHWRPGSAPAPRCRAPPCPRRRQQGLAESSASLRSGHQARSAAKPTDQKRSLARSRVCSRSYSIGRPRLVHFYSAPHKMFDVLYYMRYRIKVEPQAGLVANSVGEIIMKLYVHRRHVPCRRTSSLENSDWTSTLSTLNEART